MRFGGRDFMQLPQNNSLNLLYHIVSVLSFVNAPSYARIIIAILYLYNTRPQHLFVFRQLCYCRAYPHRGHTRSVVFSVSQRSWLLLHALSGALMSADGWMVVSNVGYLMSDVDTQMLVARAVGMRLILFNRWSVKTYR